MQIHELYKGNHIILLHRASDGGVCITIREEKHNEKVGSWDVTTTKEHPLYQEGDTILKFHSFESVLAFGQVVMVAASGFPESRNHQPEPEPTLIAE